MFVIIVLLSLGFTFTVHGQLSLIVRWNHRLISESLDNRDDRVLIYHDEINIRTDGSGGVPDGPGVLVCRYSGEGNVSWLDPSDTPIQSNNDNNFRIIESTHSDQNSGKPISRVQLAQTRSVSEDVEGLWTCDGGDLSFLQVAIYTRGNGAIATSVVTLQSSSFEPNLPTFTLVGNTTGGPPTTAEWLRDGQLTSWDRSFHISIVANPNNDQEGRVNAHYQSTLIVTGTLPGVYEYRTSNRATSGLIRAHLSIEGGNLTNLVVVLVGNSTIRVSWTPPTGPPSRGYRIVDVANGLDAHAPSSPQDLVLPLGHYNIHVTYTSLHFPGSSVGPQLIAVLGALQPIITSVLQPNATTVILSWTQPPLSFRPNYYQLTLAHTLNFFDNRSEIVVGGSGSFTNLKDFSAYKIKVIAHFEIGSNSLSTFVETEINTERKADMLERDIGVSVTATFLLTIAACAVVVYCLYRYHLRQVKKMIPADMKENVAYNRHEVQQTKSAESTRDEDSLYDNID